MKLKSQKGSITIFVLVALLFYTAFLLLMYAANTNKFKTISEKSDILKGIYEKNTDNASINNFQNKRIAEYNKEIENRKLPSEYQQVEYIESTGTQYIDTGVKDEEGIKWQIKLSFSTIDSRRLMGANMGSNFACNNGTLQIGQTNSIISVNKNDVVLIEIERTGNARIMTVRDNETIGTNPTGQNNIYICGLDIGGYNNSNSSESFIGKVYSSKIYRNNLSIRNFIPCYRKSDNKPGLYDLVENRFYTNQGDGENDFIVGPDVD